MCPYGCDNGPRLDPDGVSNHLGHVLRPRTLTDNHPLPMDRSVLREQSLCDGENESIAIVLTRVLVQLLTPYLGRRQ